MTVVVFLAVAATIVFANLSFDKDLAKGFGTKSYGWPLIWHRYVSIIWTGGERTVAWCYSTSRLAGNVAMWLAMLIASGGPCEWLLRRFRPRLRWGLRAMLAGVGIAAALCGWFAVLRDRAELQDQVIAAVPRRFPHAVKVGRWGPKWLDLLGADRYRRNIVTYGFPQMIVRADDDGERLLRQLAKLPKLRRLLFEFDRLSPGMAAALNDMRQLRRLHIAHALPTSNADDEEYRRDSRLPPIGKLTRLEGLTLERTTIDRESLAGLTKLKSLFFWRGTSNDAQVLYECLAALGKITPLEHLSIWHTKISGENLACLAGLVNLKTLELSAVFTDETSLLDRLPALPHLESLDLGYSRIGDHDLHHLAILPRLKSLGLEKTAVTGTGLEKLASLPCLEELAIDGDAISVAGLKSLLALKRLKMLHLGRKPGLAINTRYAALPLDNGDELTVPDDDLGGFRDAVQALRQANPGIVIDCDGRAISLQDPEAETYRTGYDAQTPYYSTWLPASDAPWMTAAEQANFIKQGGWAHFDDAGYRGRDGSMVTISF